MAYIFRLLKALIVSIGFLPCLPFSFVPAFLIFTAAAIHWSLGLVVFIPYFCFVWFAIEAKPECTVEEWRETLEENRRKWPWLKWKI